MVRGRPHRLACHADVRADGESGTTSSAASTRADLPLWRELADATRPPGAGEPILDVGAGTGRVSLDLARARAPRRPRSTVDPDLLRRAQRARRGLRSSRQRRRARLRRSTGRDFGLCVVPMQTVQLLGGRAGRLAFLRAVRAPPAPRGRARVRDRDRGIEPFDADAGDLGPSPEAGPHEGALYLSRAGGACGRAAQDRDRARAPDRSRARTPADAGRGATATAANGNVIELDRLTPAALAAGGAGARASSAGGPQRSAATEEHVGSTVVILGA